MHNVAAMASASETSALSSDDASRAGIAGGVDSCNVEISTGGAFDHSPQAASANSMQGSSTAQQMTAQELAADARERYIANGGTALIALGAKHGPSEGPTAKDAYNAVNIVIDYLSHYQQTMVVTNSERIAFTDVKTALFVLANSSNSNSPTSAVSHAGAPFASTDNNARISTGMDPSPAGEMIQPQS